MNGLDLRSHRDERLGGVHYLIRLLNLNLLGENVVLHLSLGLRCVSRSEPHQVRHRLGCELE